MLLLELEIVFSFDPSNDYEMTVTPKQQAGQGF
jgi:hypothetical protein